MATLEITGSTRMVELTRIPTLVRRRFVGQTAQTILTNLFSGTGWTFTLNAAYQTRVMDAEFNGVQRFDAIMEIVKRLGLHIRESVSTRHVTIDSFGSDSGLYVTNVLDPSTFYDEDFVAGIEDIEVEEDSSGIINSIIPYGAGEGTNAFTMRWSTRSIANGFDYNILTGTNPDGSTYWYLEDAASVALYGRRQITLTFKDIQPISQSAVAFEMAGNALYDVTAETIRRNKDPLKLYSVSARFPKTAPILVGDTLRTRYSEPYISELGVNTLRGFHVDETLVILGKRVNYDAQQPNVQLALSNKAYWLSNDVELITGQVQSLMYARFAPSLDTIMLDHGTYEGSVEAAGSKWFRYKVRYTDFVHLIHGFWLDFEISGLKSSTKSASSGGGSTSSAGESHSHSVSAGTAAATGSTVQVPSMTHWHAWGNFIGGPYVVPGVSEYHWQDRTGRDMSIWTEAPFGVDLETFGALQGTVFTAPTVGHTHSVSGMTAGDESSHRHTISAHTHPLTYGVFQDSLPNPATTQLYINGVLRGTYTASQSGLDFTEFMIAADGQPLRQENILEFRTTASKAYNIDAHGYSLSSISHVGRGSA